MKIGEVQSTCSLYLKKEKATKEKTLRSLLE